MKKVACLMLAVCLFVLSGCVKTVWEAPPEDEKTAEPETNVSVIPLADLIGQTVGDLYAAYPDVRYQELFYFEGGLFMRAENRDFSFQIDDNYLYEENAPERTVENIPEDTRVLGLASSGKEPVIGKLTGCMTYPEIKEAIGDQTVIGEYRTPQSPDEEEGFFGAKYTLSFEYEGHRFCYFWSDDPETDTGWLMMFP